MKKRILVFVLLTCLLFTGCDSLNLPIEETTAPPNSTSPKSTIYYFRSISDLQTYMNTESKNPDQYEHAVKFEGNVPIGNEEIKADYLPIDQLLDWDINETLEIKIIKYGDILRYSYFHNLYDLIVCKRTKQTLQEEIDYMGYSIDNTTLQFHNYNDFEIAFLVDDDNRNGVTYLYLDDFYIIISFRMQFESFYIAYESIGYSEDPGDAIIKGLISNDESIREEAINQLIAAKSRITPPI